MVKKEPTDEEKEELKKLLKETTSPGVETKDILLVKNSYNVKGKKTSQYKINIPKKFVDFLEFDKKEMVVRATLDKENNKIILEVFENR
ncbi:MAG TPA: hypothetical protein PKZ06_02530 [Candidatus Pacearchaeota archaeon]|nr:hypothetical protein [Candidatus Pacearchaeota archaeon]